MLLFLIDTILFEGVNFLQVEDIIGANEKCFALFYRGVIDNVLNVQDLNRK